MIENKTAKKWYFAMRDNSSINHFWNIEYKDHREFSISQALLLSAAYVEGRIEEFPDVIVVEK